MSTQVNWLSPSPLWPQLGANSDKTAFQSPVLLRFASDTFMQDLQSKLQQNPAGLSDFVAQPETWRSPAVGLTTSTPTSSVLKFFQPVHLRFYLVTASLTCRLPGLPDHTVKTAAGERASFVLRRLAADPQNPQNTLEYAWLPNLTPPGWMAVAGNSVAAGEDKLALFNLQAGTNGTRRRVFTGFIPVARQQAYAAGVALKADQSGKILPQVADDPRLIEFQRQVLDPWVDLIQWSANQPNLALGPVATISSTSMAAAQGSAFILIDFANYLAANLSDVWSAVQNGSAGSLTGDELALYNALSATIGDVQDASRYTLAAAINLAKSNEDAFNNETLSSASAQPGLPSEYPGPTLIDVSDPNLAQLIGRPSDTDDITQRPIVTLVAKALLQAGPAPTSPIPPPASHPDNPQANNSFIIRCVYERPQCGVHGLPPLPIVSAPSRPFQLSSYFDPDAPARKIQVALPIDTTVAALRKYDKGVGFMISDQLNQQMQRVTNLKNLMAGTVDPPGGGWGFGMICSFSIPIITICALIILFIFVLLLNIVFFWMPFLKICFPVPELTSKGS
jgi:hypothetical protein